MNPGNWTVRDLATGLQGAVLQQEPRGQDA